jgi:hypothetical protein
MHFSKQTSRAKPRAELTGTSVFTWHEGNDRYDEVEWHPEAITGDEAAALGRLKLNEDPHAVRVQVAYGGHSLLEFIRYSSN